MNSARCLALVIILVLIGCAPKAGWIDVPIPLKGTDILLSYEPSSIREIEGNKAIVNVRWVNPSGQITSTALMRFNCSTRTFLVSDHWTDQADGKGLRPYVSSYETKELDVLPNGAIEKTMFAACD